MGQQSPVGGLGVGDGELVRVRIAGVCARSGEVIVGIAGLEGHDIVGHTVRITAVLVIGGQDGVHALRELGAPMPDVGIRAEDRLVGQLVHVVAVGGQQGAQSAAVVVALVDAALAGTGLAALALPLVGHELAAAGMVNEKQSMCGIYSRPGRVCGLIHGDIISIVVGGAAGRQRQQQQEERGGHDRLNS